jgi:Yip1-like protein
MSEQMNAPMLPPPSGVSEWFSVWRDALTKPSDQTFARISQSPNAKLTTALLWVFLGSLVNILLASLVQGAIFRQLMQNSDFGGNGFPRMAGGGLVAAICGAPIGAVISIVGFVIFVGIVQLLARMFGGRGTFEQLAYATAAIVAPFSLINSLLTLLAAIPFVGLCFGLVSLLAGLYVIVLQVLAVQGVNQFSLGAALGSYFLPFIVLLCCIGIGVIGLLRALGPGINEIFNSIQQSLTPVP